MFLGNIPVTYRTDGLRVLHPGKAASARWLLTGHDGQTSVVVGPYLPSPEAHQVRDGKVREIQIIMK